ncbi:MAG: DUF1573 domain-containing protein [Endomicrobiia bacterium]
MKSNFVNYKTVVLLVVGGLCLIHLSSCRQSSTTNTKESYDTANINGVTTSIEFVKTHHNFGKIKAGEKLSYTYIFKNIGKNPLLLKNVVASCGCTVPHWDKHPISPGEKGKIEVIFDSSGRKGKQHKSITVTANTVPSVMELTFETEIE